MRQAVSNTIDTVVMLVRLFCQLHPRYSTVRPFLSGPQQNLRLSTNFTLPKRTSTVSAMSAIFSTRENEAKMKEELQSLEGTGWILDEDRMGIKKTYYFKTYTKVLDFHTIIGVRCKSKNHHPKMETGAGHVTVHWTTHFPRGLSSQDMFMARYCDEQARDNIKATERNDAHKCDPAPKAEG